MSESLGVTWDDLMNFEKRVISEQEFEEAVNLLNSTDYQEVMESSNYRQFIRDNAIVYGKELGMNVEELLAALDSAKSSDVIDKIANSDQTFMDAYLNTLWGNKVLKGGSATVAGIKSLNKGSISTSRNSGIFGNLASSLSVFSAPEVIDGFKTKIDNGTITTDDYIDFVSCMADSILSGIGVVNERRSIATGQVSSFSEMFGYKPVAGVGSDGKALAWNKTGSFKSIPKSTVALSALGVATGMGFLSANVAKYIRLKDDPNATQRDKDACIVSMTADCLGIVGDVIGMIPNPVTQIVSAAIAGINGIMKAAAYATSKDADTGMKVLAFACALVPTLNFDSIEKAIALDKLMDKAENHEDYIVFQSMYQAAVFESIPIVNMISFIFTEAAKGQLRERIKNEYGSIDRYYEVRFENRNTKQFYDAFKEILVENPKLDMLQNLNGYVYGDIDSTIRTWISDGLTHNVFFSKYVLDKDFNVINEVKNYRDFEPLDVEYNVELSNTASQDDRYTMTNVNYNQNFNRDINQINNIVQKARVNGFEAAFNQYNPLDVYSYTGILTQKEKVIKELETLTRIEDADKWKYNVFYSHHWVSTSNNKNVCEVDGLDDFRQKYFNHLVNILAQETVLSDYRVNDNNNTNNILTLGLLNFVDRTFVDMGGGDDFLSLTQVHNRDQRYYVVADGGEGKDKVDLSKLMYLNGNLQKINSTTLHTARYNIDLMLNQMDVTIDYGTVNRRHSWFAGKNDDVNELFRLKNFEIHQLANGVVNEVAVSTDDTSVTDGQFVIIGGDTTDKVDFRNSTKTGLAYRVEDGSEKSSSNGTYDSVIQGSSTNDYIDMKYKAHSNDQGSNNRYLGHDGNDIFVVKGGTPSGINKLYADGGEGFDTLDLSELANGAKLKVNDDGSYKVEYFDNSGSKTGEDIGTNIEYYKGTNNDDIITGSSGDDTIDSMDGSDTVNSGAGADNIILRNGYYNVNAGEGEDRIYIGEKADGVHGIINGGNDEDTLDLSNYGSAIRSSFHRYWPKDNLQYMTRNGTFSLINIENIIGSNFNDAINGDDGDNKLYGLSGDDTIYGYNGNDILSGGQGVNVLHGGDGDDVMLVGEGDDSAYGEIGDDKFLVKGDISNNSLLNGGAGNDVAIYNEVEYSIIADLSLIGSIAKSANSNMDFNDFNISDTETRADSLSLQEIKSIASANNIDSLISIESVFGGKGNDLLVGTNTDNILNGGDGDDKIYGFGGNDEIGDGSGNDIVYAGAGDDKISVNEGNDRIYGGSGEEVIFVDDSSQYSNFIDGGSEEDTAVYKDSKDGRIILMTDDITADQLDQNYNLNLNNRKAEKIVNVENIVGTAHNDKIFGNNLANQLHGYDGDDLIYAGDGDDEISSGTGNNVLYGQGGNDKFILEGTFDIAHGDDGDDIFYRKGTSADRKKIDGGIGTDEVAYTMSEVGISVDLSAIDNEGYSNVNLKNSEGVLSTQIDRIKDVEDIKGTNYSDSIKGNNKSNTLAGFDGDDELFGEGGDDVIATGAGNDTAHGGDGKDIILVGEGANNIYGDNNDDQLDVVGSATAHNTLDGGEGIDTVTYTEVDYKVIASLETKRIDKYSADGSSNSLLGYDTIDNIEVLSLTNYADRVYGSSLSDTIIGYGGDDTIDGYAGNDILVGGEGNDTLNGGDGNDTLVIGQGNDTVNGGLDNDTIMYVGDSSETNNTIDGEEGHDIVDYSALNGKLNVSYVNDHYQVFKAGPNGSLEYGIDNLNNIEEIIGSNKDDFILGRAGSDIFHGNEGDDTIYGYEGNDMLFGDGGSDTIYAGDGDDEIYVDNFDKAYGQYGDDTFFVQKLENSGTGNIVGGEGIDKIEYTESNTGIRGSLGESMFFRTYNSATDGITYSSTEFVNGIENVVGSNFDDAFGGDDGVNILDGMYGDDRINGLGGDDLIYGGYGNDYLLGEDGDDTLVGGANDDVLNGGSGNDVLKGQEGNNVYEYDGYYGFGNDIIDNYYEGATFLENSDNNKIHLKYIYNPGDLYFKKDGNDLNISVRDKGEIKVNNWFLHDSFKIDSIYLHNGEDYIITSDKVKLIMEATDIYSKYRNQSYEELYNMKEAGLYEMVRRLSLPATKTIDDLGSDYRFVKEYYNVVEKGIATVSSMRGNNLIENVNNLNVYNDNPINTISFSYLTPSNYRLGLEFIKFEKANGNLSLIDVDNNRYTINNWDSLNGSVSIAFSSQVLTGEKIDYIINSMEKYSEVTGLSWDQAIDQADYKYENFMRSIIYGSDLDLSTLDYEFDFTNEYNQRHGINIDSSSIFGDASNSSLDFSESKRNIWADLATGQVSVGKSLYTSPYYMEDSNRDIYVAKKTYTDNISNIIGGSSGDYIKGSSYDNIIDGKDGQDYLNGLAGQDTIYGGKGEDRLYGGIGNDSLYGGDDRDQVFGGSGDDRIFGDAGNDFLSGEYGNDYLSGGSGTDEYMFYSWFDEQTGMNLGFGNDVVEDNGVEKDTLMLTGYGINEMTFDMNGNDLVINLSDYNSSVTVKNFDDAKDYDIMTNCKTNDLGALISQISAYESTWNLSWDDMMKKSRSQAYSENLYQARMAAESIVGYNY